MKIHSSEPVAFCQIKIKTMHMHSCPPEIFASLWDTLPRTPSEIYSLSRADQPQPTKT